MSPETEATPPARGRKRVLAGATILVVAAVIVAVVATTRGGRPKSSGNHADAAGAATVERRNLVTSENESGKISYEGSATVSNRLQGTLTWVPSVGRVIDPGQRLFDVDNFPVILMDGSTPAYRTLDSSDSPGPDIRQLNANLIALGFDPDGIAEDDEWQPATTAGVEAFQEAHGERETGSLALGTIVFLRGAQRVAALDTGGRSVSDDDPLEAHDEFVGYTPTTGTATIAPTTTTTKTTPTTATTKTTPTTSPTKTTPTTPGRTTPGHGGNGLTRAEMEISRLQGEIQQLERQNEQLDRALAASKSHSSSHHPSSKSPSGGSKSPSGSGDSGPVSGGDSPVMTTTSTNLVVTVDMSAGQQGVTRVGARVPVVMPSGATVYGHVVRIGQATSGANGGSTVPITIHLDRHENGRDLDQATVSVTFVEKTARNVLSVPVTALLAEPGGRYAVQEARPPYKLIDVTLGTFATGYAQISGAGLHPGLSVTDAQG